ncbi:MAG: class I SAM-dependent methyltransferase [Crocinitomicaceae bacterium]|nr:class I SAM-dependent methyltransferase [Crocinitomicaceae bacterium]
MKKLKEKLNDFNRVLEIGGPSPHPNDIIYQTKAPIDGCNHKTNIWQGEINNQTYRNGGAQYFGDALDFDIPFKEYDVIYACHVLEHMANPIKALLHWKKFLKNEGFIYLVLPQKSHCFDRNRPTTKIQTLVEKFIRDVDESDLSSLPEILELHDLPLDPPAGTPEQFKARSLDNANNRCLHHHVFDFDLLEQVCESIGMKVFDKEIIHGLNQHIAFR